MSHLAVVYFVLIFLKVVEADRLPEGIKRERAVADADLITLLTGRGEVRFSPESPESSRCRARRTARSLVALGVIKSGLSLLLLRV